MDEKDWKEDREEKEIKEKGRDKTNKNSYVEEKIKFLQSNNTVLCFSLLTSTYSLDSI